MPSRGPKSRPKPVQAGRVIAIGASAGGIKGLIEILPKLPLIPNCCLLIVVHLHPAAKSFLAEILSRFAHFEMKQAQDGEPICAGVAYIAPPDFHLVLDGNCVRLRSSALVRLHRPSVDVMFESVAREQGPKAIAVLLSGSGQDGSDGLRSMKMSGASTIVQDPAEAMFSSMPAHGVATGCADFIIPLRSIGAQISLLCAQG